MRIKSVVSSEESCDEIKAVSLNQASPGAEEVQWTWKREALQMTKVNILPYSRRVIIEEITEELKLIGEGVYQEFLNSCFGSLMCFDTQGVSCCTALHWLFAHEVVKADAGPEELWYRVGGRFIRFSKYEYALVTGLSFGPTTFDPSAEHHPPASGLFSRHYRGQRLKMDTLRRDFTAGVFRESPADALKVAKLLFVYFLLFGMNGRVIHINEWAWTLIEDSDGWEAFIWGNYTYQILLTSLQQLPTELPPVGKPTHHVYGFVWAFLIWAFEAIPGLRIACGVHASNDVLPRCLRWRFPKMNPVDMEGFCDHQMEVYSTLEPSAVEQRQTYWEHITDDLRSDVCYISVSRHRRSKKRKRTDPLTTHALGVADQEKAPLSSAQHSKDTYTLRSCHTSAAPMTGKRKRTDPLTTRGSSDLSEHECGRQDEMASIIQKEFFSQRNSLSPRHTPDDLPVGGASSSVWIDCPVIQSKCIRSPATVFRRDDNMNSEPELSNVAVGKAEWNTSIFKLIEKIHQLKNKNMENERLMGVHEEKCKCLDIKIFKMSQEMEDLRQEKLEAGQVVKELKHKNLKANKIIDELRLEKSESDKVARLYKGKLEKLSPIIKKTDLVNNACKLVTSKDVGDLDFPNDADNLDSPLPGVHLTFNSSGISKKGAHASGTRLICDKISAENLKMTNEKNNLFSGFKEKIEELRDLNLENERLVGIYKEKCKGLVKMGQEVDDEKLAFIKTVEELRCKNIEANKTIDELRLKKSESDQVAEGYKSKLDKVAGMLTMKVGDIANLVNDIRELATSDDAENVGIKSSGSKNSGLSKKGAHASIGTRLMSGEGYFSKIVRSSSTSAGDDTEILDSDDDESLSDSRINAIISSLRSEKLGKKWMCVADMLGAFQHNEELCMNAVCVLYRQESQLKGSSINRGFSPVDSMSGCALAEYLIDGDKELRLRKSVLEVKKERPDVIGQCRKLATIYIDKLFAIYCAADDPFFGQS